MKSIFLPKGLARELDAEKGHGFDLTKYFISLLKKFGVSFYNPCCKDQSEGAPVRWFGNKLQKFNTTTEAWEDVTAFDEN